MSNPRGGSILYMMLNIPLILVVKIGITGGTAKGRAKQVTRAAPGIAVPIGIMFWPGFAYQIEQFLHHVLEPIRIEFYHGDGHKEWFFIIAAGLYYPIMLLNWTMWYYIAGIVLKQI